MNIVENLPKVNGYFLQAHIPEEAFKAWDREAKRELVAEHTKICTRALMKQLAKISQLTTSGGEGDKYQIEFREEWL